jgi:hypothetical protein
MRKVTVVSLLKKSISQIPAGLFLAFENHCRLKLYVDRGRLISVCEAVCMIGIIWAIAGRSAWNVAVAAILGAVLIFSSAAYAWAGDRLAMLISYQCVVVLLLSYAFSRILRR